MIIYPDQNLNSDQNRCDSLSYLRKGESRNSAALPICKEFVNTNQNDIITHHASADERIRDTYCMLVLSDKPGSLT